MRNVFSRRLGACGIVIPVVAALLGVAGCATRGESAGTPEEVVRRFCLLDFEGARLSSDTWPEVEPLVAWETAPDADPVILVSGFEVGEVRGAGEEAEVTVRYAVLGSMGVPWKAPAAVAVDEEGGETVTFRLVRESGVWKVAEPAPPPHSSPEALARVLRSWPQTGFGGNTDSRLQDALRYLESLRR